MYLVTYRSKSLIMYSSSACTRCMFEKNATHCNAQTVWDCHMTGTDASMYTRCLIGRCSRYCSALAPVLACQRGTSTKMYEQISAFQSAGLRVYCCVLDKTEPQVVAGPRHTLNPPACYINMYKFCCLLKTMHHNCNPPSFKLSNVGNLCLAILHQLTKKKSKCTQADLQYSLIVLIGGATLRLAHFEKFQGLASDLPFIKGRSGTACFGANIHG